MEAKEPGHYRSISLYIILCKICANILVCRLKPILPWLINPEQGAFIGGCSISDNILIDQEFMHDL